MIGEAVDTALTLGWALLAWIAVAAFVATVVLFAAAATGTWAWRAAWRALTGPWTAEQPHNAPEVDPIPFNAPHARSRPSWARTDKDTA